MKYYLFMLCTIQITLSFTTWLIRSMCPLMCKTYALTMLSISLGVASRNFFLPFIIPADDDYNDRDGIEISKKAGVHIQSDKRTFVKWKQEKMFKTWKNWKKTFPSCSKLCWCVLKLMICVSGKSQLKSLKIKKNCTSTEIKKCRDKVMQKRFSYVASSDA